MAEPSRRKKAAPATDTLRTQIGNFALIPNWVFDACRDPRAIQLYILLWKFGYREHEVRAWPSRSQLLAAMNTSGRSLDRAIAALKEIHALKVKLRHRADGAVVGVDYLLMQAPPPLQHHFATHGEMDEDTGEIAPVSESDTALLATGGEMDAEDALSATGGEVEPPPFRQKRQAFSPPVANAYKEEQDPDNKIQVHEERTAPPAPLRPAAETVFGAELSASDPCDAFLIVWNATIRPPLLPVRTLTPKRRRLIRTRLLDATVLIELNPTLAGLSSLEVWRHVIARIAASPFCRGSKDWVASLDWLIAAPDPAVKALEGQYGSEPIARVDGPVTAAEFAAALRELVDGHGNQCPHRHTCADRGACVEAIARAARAMRRSA